MWGHPEGVRGTISDLQGTDCGHREVKGGGGRDVWDTERTMRGWVGGSPRQYRDVEKGTAHGTSTLRDRNRRPFESKGGPPGQVITDPETL